MSGWHDGLRQFADAQERIWNAIFCDGCLEYGLCAYCSAESTLEDLEARADVEYFLLPPSDCLPYGLKLRVVRRDGWGYYLTASDEWKWPEHRRDALTREDALDMIYQHQGRQA